jgi:predicted secreted hydrolase
MPDGGSFSAVFEIAVYLACSHVARAKHMKPRWLYIAILTVSAILLCSCGRGEKPVQGSGLAVLAQHVETYTQARPGQPLVFPLDHGPHPGYRIEWWYLTTNLNDAEGRAYGAQWTLFRLAVQPPGEREPADAWQNDQVFMAHFAITTADDHVSFQRYSRSRQDQEMSRAGVTAEPFSAWLDDWVLQSTRSGWLPLEVKARQDEYALQLKLRSSSPLVLQGEAGFSKKHFNGGGSFYYSQPFLEASGELLINGQKVPVTGEAWLDREWSSQFLQGGQVGWDWFSLHLESGEKLMLFQLRQGPGENQDENFLQGMLMAPDGSTTALESGRIKMKVVQQSDVAGRDLPLHWHIDLPQIKRQFDIRPLHPEQWLDVDFPYWEGAIIVAGDGSKNSGRGYMELTGYPVR